MMNIFGEEEFKPLVRFGKMIPGYYVAKDGRGILGKKGKILSVWKDTKGYPTSSVSIRSDFFSDYTYKTQQKGKNISLKLNLHRAVIETWNPIDENPPESLKEEWNQVITPEMVGQPRIPQSYKKWVEDTAFVDHIDSDITNNDLTNLRWVIPKDNESNRKNYKLNESL